MGVGVRAQCRTVKTSNRRLASEMGYCADPHPPPGRTGQGGSVLIPTSIGRWEPQTEPLSGCHSLDPLPRPQVWEVGVGKQAGGGRPWLIQF